MNIGIDVRSLLEPERSGVGEYTYELLSALFRIDQTNNYHLFANAYQDASIDHLLPVIRSSRVTTHNFRYPNKLLNAGFTFLNTPKIDRLVGGLDLFFMPNINFVALSPSVPLVLTLHDLSFEHFPSFFSKKSQLWHSLINPKRLAANASHLLAVSEHTKRDVVNRYTIPNERITVTYPGVHTRFFEEHSDASLAEVRERYHLPPRFILFLSTLEPRKNVQAAIDAFSVLREEPNYQDLHLVLAGRRSHHHQLDEKNIPYIHTLDYVLSEDRPALCRLAEAFVYPSFYEGFGLPPLEAMASGTPVIASHVSSIGEVVGDSGILIDPYNTGDLIHALRLVLNNQPLRENLVLRGHERAKQFEWEETARKTLNVFDTIGKQR